MYESDNCLLFFQKLYVDFILFYKLNADYVFYPAVMGELTSARSSLLWTIVATSE
jgi:hypothetical protein